MLPATGSTIIAAISPLLASKAFLTEFISLYLHTKVSLTTTSGTGILHHLFDHYAELQKNIDNKRQNGVLISNSAGKAMAFALWNLQERGRMLIGPQTEVYEGMVVGIHSRDNDLVVNVII